MDMWSSGCAHQAAQARKEGQSMTTPTPERIAVCQSRVHGEEMVRDFAFCNLWKPHLTRAEALQWFAPLERRGWHSRPCTSPRRYQCRSGGAPQKPDPGGQVATGPTSRRGEVIAADFS